LVDFALEKQFQFQLGQRALLLDNGRSRVSTKEKGRESRKAEILFKLILFTKEQENVRERTRTCQSTALFHTQGNLPIENTLPFILFYLPTGPGIGPQPAPQLQ
jgi:hypothetical protein